MILFECMTVGKRLYRPMDIYRRNSTYWSLHRHKLKEHLTENGMLKFFNTDSFSLLTGLLNVNESKRLKGMDILKHKWFNMYYTKYRRQILKKFNGQNQELIKQKRKMIRNQFPFYRMLHHQI